MQFWSESAQSFQKYFGLSHQFGWKFIGNYQTITFVFKLGLDLLFLELGSGCLEEILTVLLPALPAQRWTEYIFGVVVVF
jgi:hypothetical protein